jgi:hypothetical protein
MLFDDAEPCAFHHHADKVLADVVNVALDRADHHLSLFGIGEKCGGSAEKCMAMRALAMASRMPRPIFLWIGASAGGKTDEVDMTSMVRIARRRNFAGFGPASDDAAALGCGDLIVTENFFSLH